ncbi:hypothetical protein ACN47E_008983 [Coniothyrium glycines]
MEYTTAAMPFAPSQRVFIFWQPQQCRSGSQPPCPSLLDPTSIPSTSSSSPALINNLGADAVLADTSNWNPFPLPVCDSQYLDDATHLLSGDSSLFSVPNDSINLVAMSSGMSTAASIPMIKDLSNSGSSSAASKDFPSPSPEQSSPNLKSSTKNSPLAPDPSRIEKRKANTLAARRYRQKRVDQMSGLETELKEVKTERDDLKVRCARLEGEVETLRALLRAQK